MLTPRKVRFEAVSAQSNIFKAQIVIHEPAPSFSFRFISFYFAFFLVSCSCNLLLFVTWEPWELVSCYLETVTRGVGDEEVTVRRSPTAPVRSGICFTPEVQAASDGNLPKQDQLPPRLGNKSTGRTRLGGNLDAGRYPLRHTLCGGNARRQRTVEVLHDCVCPSGDGG